ncbi:SpaH/EbpB family LPXTG-anchored major pilin [Gemmiger qucibialis]|uniref:SpaH/EbpB family LPXTG-anchored major pilin n=1 Tax=Gemmiger qucibialis TaxID=2997294 RepID=UPI0022E3FC21|nr:SpaH/EbpB family LPXTG-anchored major pilin [Gemmiger qucibialis]
MKKAKRFLTGLLSAALALSLCAMPAMAAEGEGNAQTPEIKTSVSTIDKTKKGSITIYKYLHSTELTGSVAGTGEQQTVPNGATPLKDAGFTIYQVKTADELVAYYEAASDDAAVTADSFFKTTDNKTAANLKEGIANKAVKDKDGKTERKTDANGFVKFADLSVGMYLVIETTPPDSVVKPVDPFLVSIPMTRVQDGEQAADGQLKEWLYDVVVYPKNSSAKGDITLIKKGKTDGKKDEIKNLPDVIFKLQRYNVNSANEDKYDDYTVDNTCEFTTNNEGKITVKSLLKGKYRFVEIGYVENKESGYIINNNVAYEFEIDDQGKLVTPDGATPNSDFVINDDNTMTVYNHKPDLEKDVKQRDTTKGSDAGNDTDYAVGDTVEYTLTIYVPENVAKLNTFKVVDTMNKNQLMHNIDSVTISSKSVDGKDVTFAANTDYTLTNTSNGNNSEITIDFKAGTSQDKLKAAAGKTITISYTATLQEDADTTTVGNVNEAHLDYSRKTDIQEGDIDTPYEIHDKAVVYTFKTGILKKGQDGNTVKLLNGVTFDLYKKYDEKTDKLKEGTPDTVIFGIKECKFLTAEEAKALGLNATEAENQPKWFKVATLTTAGEGENAGRATVNGLPDGEYKLVETMTNKGYNLLSGPVDANLTVDYATSWTANNKFSSDGKLIKRDVKTTTFKNGNTPYSYAEILIINRKGFDLPTTGGFGTLLFSGIGVLLVVAGVGVLLSLKKKNRA